MAIFEYTAIDKGGKSIKGSIDAETSRSARQKLRAKGLYPTEIKEGHEAAVDKSRDVLAMIKKDKVALKDLAVATRQLATLVNAGLPIVDSLTALSDQVESQTLKRIIIDVRDDVKEGSALAKAIGKFPKSFPRLYINMVQSGEASGSLDAVLENLADYLEAQLELKRKVTSSLFYPILMLIFCTLIIIALLTFVVPSIVDIFIKQGATLPLPTRIVLGISNFITGYWPILVLAVIGIVLATRAYYRQERGRFNVDKWLLQLPIIGSLFLKINTARIARTLGTLLTNGVGLLEALTIVRNIIANVHLSGALVNAKEGVREGRSLAIELKKAGIFPPMLMHMIAVGEKSGALEPMLVKAGAAYEREVNATLSGLTSLIEPIMMIVMGFIVFAIVISILLPMVELINIVQG